MVFAPGQAQGRLWKSMQMSRSSCLHGANDILPAPHHDAHSTTPAPGSTPHTTHCVVSARNLSFLVSDQLGFKTGRLGTSCIGQNCSLL